MEYLAVVRKYAHKAWPFVVLVSSMVAHATSVGFSYGILGTFTVAQARYLNISIYQSSWTGATHLSTFFLTSPLTAALAKSVSPSVVQIVGGVVMIFGVGSTAWAKHQWHSILSFGLMTGLGISLVRSASSAALPFYFHNDAAQFAMAALMVGFTCGMSGLPILCSYIFSLDNFPDTMLTVSKIMFIHILCGLAYVPATLSDPESKGFKFLQTREQCKETLTSLSRVMRNIKVWSYLWASLFRRFGLTAFFTLITNYLIANPKLSVAEIAQGRMTLGCTAIVGVVAMCVTQNEKFHRLIPHALSPGVCGVVMMSMTLAENDISFTMLMALFGLAFGSLLGNNLLAIGTLVHGEEVKLVVMLEFIMEGLGSIGGSPSTSYIQEVVNLNAGIYYAGSFCILSGLITLVMLVIKLKDPPEEKNTEQERPVRTIIHIKPYDHSRSKYTVKQVNQEMQPLLPPNTKYP